MDQFKKKNDKNIGTIHNSQFYHSKLICIAHIGWWGIIILLRVLVDEGHKELQGSHAFKNFERQLQCIPVCQGPYNKYLLNEEMGLKYSLVSILKLKKKL